MMKRLIYIAALLLATSAYAGVEWYAVLARKNAAPAAPSFVPTDVGGLYGWWKADAGVLESDLSAAEDGEAVVAWEDQSGGGNDLTVTNATWVEATPSVTPTESDTFLRTPALATGNSSVYIAHSSVDLKHILLGVPSGPFTGAANDADGSTTVYNTDTSGTYYSNLVSLAANRDALHDGWNIGASVVMSVVNFTEATSDYSWGILEWTGQASWNYGGDVYEILWYTNTVSLADHTNIVNYLEGRW